MRLHFQLTPNTQTVPFDYQHFLTGRLHAWLGNNDLHDGISLYSLSWLHGGVTRRDGQPLGGLNFPDGARWFISAHEADILVRVCKSARHDPLVCCGMSVSQIQIESEPEVRERQTFKVSSPVLARGKQIEGKVRHYLYTEIEADEILTQTLRHKLDQAGLSRFSAQSHVRFERKYQGARTKMVTINGISHRCSLCPVVVEGPIEVVEFAWNVGIGHLTGSGFGALS